MKATELQAEAVEEIPNFIGLRVGKYEPLIKKWREDNRRVPWARLLDDGLKLALRPYAGKRHAHLVESFDPMVDAFADMVTVQGMVTWLEKHHPAVAAKLKENNFFARQGGKSPGVNTRLTAGNGKVAA